ncbi:MAG: DUF4251 domain-containing protein [Ferruginibacter sp.]
MKKKNSVFCLLSLVGLLIITSCSSSKTGTINNQQDTGIAQAIDTGRWTFNVTMVNPQSGPSTLPNGFYTVSYSPQNLNVYLPYIGQAFGGADVLSQNNPLGFISKDFEIKKTLTKKGKWTIEFKPRDQKQVQSLTFTLFNSGSASLNVVMTNRTPISYTGTVQASIK